MTREWQEQVRRALAAADRESLATLFAAAVSADGSDRASQEWLEVVSAMDSSAQTG